MMKTNATSETKRQLINKSSSTIVVSMAAAAFILSFSLVTINFLWDLSQHNLRIIAKKAEASEVLKQNVENIEKLQKSFVVLEAGDVKSSTILDALPSKYDFPALATSIESLVQRSGMTLESFSGDDLEDSAIQEATQPTPVELEFSINVSGSYSDLQKLISNLERTIRPMKITQFELKGNDTRMTSTLQITTYYQPATSLDVETRTIE